MPTGRGVVRRTKGDFRSVCFASCIPLHLAEIMRFFCARRVCLLSCQMAVGKEVFLYDKPKKLFPDPASHYGAPDDRRRPDRRVRGACLVRFHQSPHCSVLPVLPADPAVCVCARCAGCRCGRSVRLVYRAGAVRSSPDSAAVDGGTRGDGADCRRACRTVPPPVRQRASCVADHRDHRDSGRG